ncbi:MAG: RsmE family RNA methyltransferase [Balneolaceae bacterium]
MNLFYTQPENVRDNYLSLEGQEAHHAVKVLRYGVGDSILVTEGQGGRYTGKIESVSKNQVVVKVEDSVHHPPPVPKVTLAVGLIKKRDRLEFAIEKAVELGAWQIIVFQGIHSEKTGVRMDRLEITALSAMKQSLRLWLPEILHYESLENVLSRHPEDQMGVADEQVSAENESEVCEDMQEFRKGSALMIIGPEGGFSEFERELMEKEEVVPFSLGPFRLRTETAVVSLMSRLRVGSG